MTNTTSVTERKISGKLGSVRLHDIIQLLEMTKRTVTVRLRAGALDGRLYFRDGQIVHASGGGFEGEDSVIELLSWTDPEFTIEDGIDSLPKITISKRTDALLLGTLIRLDETRRDDVVHERISPRSPSAPGRRRIPTRRRVGPQVRVRQRLIRALGGLAGLACLPIAWLMIAPHVDSTREWLAPWNDVPAFEARTPVTPAPVTLPDAWAVASSVSEEQEEMVLPRPTPQTASTAPGYLTVVVEPWARVAIDGVPKGETPLGRIEIEPGPTRLVLDNDHVAGLIRDDIEIESGRAVLKRYSFEDVGYLRVVVTPWADVSVDGRPIGQTPMGRIRIVAGSHSILFSHPDLEDVERLVQIRSGETTFVRVRLSH